MNDRATFYTRYPWLKPHANPELLVMGDDLDAALSTALFLHQHPAARLVGLYSRYTQVLYAESLTRDELLGALWLDLDIYHPRCRSLGHHIVRLSLQDRLPGFATSCNLNEVCGKFMGNFRQKYPLGTIHFLMWLYGVEIPALPHADLLIWLADSAYINAQARSHRRNYRGSGNATWQERDGFRWNVSRWLHTALPLDSLLASFKTLDTPAFEERMEAFQQVMEAQGFRQGYGQVASHYRKLSGYQCQPQGQPARYVHRLLEFVAQQTGWSFEPGQIAPLAGRLKVKTGQRRRETVENARREGLDAFLQRRGIFSYVFQSARVMNYTQFGTRDS